MRDVLWCSSKNSKKSIHTSSLGVLETHWRGHYVALVSQNPHNHLRVCRCEEKTRSCPPPVELQLRLDGSGVQDTQGVPQPRCGSLLAARCRPPGRRGMVRANIGRSPWADRALASGPSSASACWTRDRFNCNFWRRSVAGLSGLLAALARRMRMWASFLGPRAASCEVGLWGMSCMQLFRRSIGRAGCANRAEALVPLRS